MLQKSLAVDADTIIYDLEDSVAPSQKNQARTSLISFLDRERENLPRSAKLAVRINAMNTTHFEDDVAALGNVPTSQLSTIVIPKVINMSPMIRLSGRFRGVRPWNLIASIESARGLWCIGTICSYNDANVKLTALLVSPDQLCTFV
jgi:citrate lyase subunit beta-like protein